MGRKPTVKRGGRSSRKKVTVSSQFKVRTVWNTLHYTNTHTRYEEIA